MPRWHCASSGLGLDLSREQLAEQPARLVLEHGSALVMPFGDGAVDKCYSVEAAQHFEDRTAFATEARRVLRPGGKLCAAPFFATDESAPGDGIDYAVPIEAFRAGLHEVGFADVRVESIGDRVRQGFDTWVSQTQCKGSWGRNWLKANRAGLADYFLVTASVSRVTSRK
ncbi:class I SAM-dependent methyltransferase [Allokutzneria oryzae]|uniref:Class I SAM-dependent methyltransferase n=1 Tax=Allokutzneria oryzae TaxID=1378989 RepID=A0ABV5ZVA8_9PSEU